MDRDLLYLEMMREGVEHDEPRGCRRTDQRRRFTVDGFVVGGGLRNRRRNLQPQVLDCDRNTEKADKDRGDGDRPSTW